MNPPNIIERILSDNYDGDMVQQLYGAFYKGYPIENLRQLIVSEDDGVRATGSYLVYELGEIAYPLIEDIIILLNDSNPQIRSDAIISLTDGITRGDKEAHGKIILKLDDPDTFVHRATISYIARQAHNIGLIEATKMRPGTIFEEIAQMTSHSSHITKTTLEILINHNNPIARRFGVGMALRPRRIINAEFLEIAKACNDDEGLGQIKHYEGLSRPFNAKIGYIDFKYQSSFPSRQT